jgi:hypothetical protein
MQPAKKRLEYVFYRFFVTLLARTKSVIFSLPNSVFLLR